MPPKRTPTPQESFDRRLILLWFGVVLVLMIIGLFVLHTRFARWDGTLLLVAIFVPALLIQFQRRRGGK
jgi:Ca2+/Na+ antiporter